MLGAIPVPQTASSLADCASASFNMTRGNAQPRGRHHVGTLAGFRLECMAGFVGIGSFPAGNQEKASCAFRCALGVIQLQWESSGPGTCRPHLGSLAHS